MAPNSKYFYNFDIDWNVEDVIPSGSREASLREKARRIEKLRLERVYGFTSFMKTWLYRKRLPRLETDGRKLNAFVFRMTRAPEPGFRFETGVTVCADVACDPEKLLEPSKDHRFEGEKLIALSKQGLGRLSAIEGFPTNHVIEACDAYRERDFTTRIYSLDGNVEGAPLKYRIDVIIDAVSTKRICTIFPRGKEMLSTTLNEIDEVNWSLTDAFHGVELQEDVLICRPRSVDENLYWAGVLSRPFNHPLHDPIEIDLNGFPEVREFMVEKGWIQR